MCDDNNTTESQLYLLLKGTICKTEAKYLKVVLQSKFRILDSIVSTPTILSRAWNETSETLNETSETLNLDNELWTWSYYFPLTLFNVTDNV